MRNLFIALACLIMACTEVHHHHYGAEPATSEEETASMDETALPDGMEPPLAVPANVSELPRAEPLEPASEPVNLVILSIGTLEGDDELAHSFTEALRRAAASNRSIDLDWRHVALEQMMIAHDCAISEPGCLHSMAQTLRAENLLVGAMHRRVSVDGYEHVVEMARFDAARRSVVHTYNVILSRHSSREYIMREAFQVIHELFPSSANPEEREATELSRFVSL